MPRNTLCLFLTLGLLGPSVPLPAQVVTDAEVVRGIRLVEEGDHDEAILMLDSATRRLAAAHGDPGELAQAYLYLGIAYLAKGHETSAKARFRDAVLQVRSLTLSPEKFAPRVVELFEVAREEVAKMAAAQPSSPPPASKSGSKKGLIILGAGAAAAAGIALGTSGGDKTAAGAPASGRRTETFTGTVTNPGTLGPATSNQDPRVWFTLLTPRGSGSFDAMVSWNTADAILELYLWERPATGQPFIAQSTATGSTSAQLSSSVTGQQHQLNVFYARCRTAACPAAPFSLTVTYP